MAVTTDTPLELTDYILTSPGATGLAKKRQITDLQTLMGGAPGGGTVGTKVYYLSTIAGVFDDAVLTKYSTTFGTNSQAAIQAILDDPARKCIFWDVAVSGTGFVVNSNTAIFATPGCGGILRDNSNAPIIRLAGDSVTSITNHDIIIDGGIWNGNATHSFGGAFVQTTGGVDTGTNCGFAIYGVRNFTLRNVEILNVISFAVLAVWTENLKIEWVKTDTVIDGVDIVGYNKNFYFGNARLKTGDDKYVCASEPLTGWNPEFGAYYAGAGGLCEGVVENIYFDGGNFGGRYFGTIDRLNVRTRNVTGSCKEYTMHVMVSQLIIDHADRPGNGNNGMLLFEDCEVIQIDAGAGNDTHGQWTFSGNTDNVVMKNCGTILHNQSTRPFAAVYMETGQLIRNFTMDGCYVRNQDGDDVDMTLLDFKKGEIEHLTVKGCILKSDVPNDSKLVHIGADATAFVVDIPDYKVNGGKWVLHKEGAASFVRGDGFHVNSPDILIGSFDEDSAQTDADLDVERYTGYNPATGAWGKKRGTAFATAAMGDLPD